MVVIGLTDRGGSKLTREEFFNSMAAKNEAVYRRVNGKTAPVLTLEFITGIIGAITAAIRGCRSPETAASHIKDGTPTAYLAMRKVYRDEGYRGRDLKKMAMEAAKEGTKMSEAELQFLISEAKDVPAPIPVAPPNSWWPAVLLFALVLLSNSASASDMPKMWWPIDAEQNTRLDKHDETLQEFAKRLTAIETNLTGANKLLVKAEKVDTTICRCGGSNKDVCHCLKAGLQCKCSASVGSEWKVEQGKAVSKTGNYFNPLTNKPLSKAAVPSVASAVVYAPTYSQVASVPQFTYVCDGRRCRRVRIR